MARARRNLVDARTETWRPPPLGPPGPFRRFIDLQVASIWRDVRPEIARAEGTIVDAGCGGQPFRGAVGARARYIGLDTADAAEHFGYERPDTLLFDGDRWPLDDTTADFVLCTETLEHVLEPEKLLREAHRCLRPGGELLLTTPFAARWHFIPHDYWRYTPSSLAHLLSSAGFTDIRIYARGNALTVACLKIISLAASLLLATGGTALSTLGRRVAGLVCLPLALAVAAVGHLTLRLDGGDDCLGYTVLAVRRG